ncbi:Translation elongation factor EF-Ts [Gracilaria domingensis]|nr:Translation elongation factor EF-Ts [Gracilaria domingensis]
MAAIKELRARTGAPIAAVKKALEEQGGDIEASIEHLRKLGASMAAKRAHREASEGLVSIAISSDKRRAAIVELNSETDFVARTPQFGELARSVADTALVASTEQPSSVVSLDPRTLLQGKNEDLLSQAVSSLGENIVLKRASLLQLREQSGAVYGYVHGALAEGGGKIGVLVALEGSATEDIGHRVAMHIAAATPNYLDVESVPKSHIEKERSVLIEATKYNQKGGSPKPPKILERIVNGKINKWLTEVVLEEQEMLVEGPDYQGKPRSVSHSVSAASRNAVIHGFLRFAVGDKIDPIE